MPYYGHIYYGYGDFLANNLYVLLLIPVLLLSLWAQFQVSGSFRRYNAVNNRRRITGAQAAEAVLRAHGVFGVPVRPCRGNLTDHYDPRDNTIYLSETVYDAPTIAAVGVAAHEAGHAVQYAENYGPVRLRTAIIPATRIGSSLSFILLLVGLVLYNQSLFFIGIVLFSFTTLFQLVTLRRISQSLMDRIHRNYRFIVGFNLGLILLGVAGILPPTTSALLHNASTLGISLKSMTDLLPEPEATVPEKSGE